jgi:hypothetical protein
MRSAHSQGKMGYAKRAFLSNGDKCMMILAKQAKP